MVLAGALGVVAACGDDSSAVSEPIYVVGDSTMAQVVEYTSARGSAEAGCGYTSEAPCLIPLEPRIDAELIIAAVSYWDRRASPEAVRSGYRDYHERLSAFAPVVWVGMPPNFVAGGDPSLELAEMHNDAVGEALGCVVAPWALREGASYDGIHYMEPGPAAVAANLATLGSDDACEA